MFSIPTKKSKSAPGQKRKKKKTQAAGDVRRTLLPCIFNLNAIPGTTLSFLLHNFLYDACMRRPGSFAAAWSSWHLQVISLHSVRFIHIVLLYYFLVSERSERKPPAERNALYRLVQVKRRKFIPRPKSTPFFRARQ